MNDILSIRLAASPALHSLRKRLALMLALAVALSGAITPRRAHAVDGCLVLLCFAAPSWRSIPQCVPPIRQVLRDLARGKPFPTCGMAGAGNSASHAWASAGDPGYQRSSPAGFAARTASR